MPAKKAARKARAGAILRAEEQAEAESLEGSKSEAVLQRFQKSVWSRFVASKGASADEVHREVIIYCNLALALIA